MRKLWIDLDEFETEKNNKDITKIIKNITKLKSENSTYKINKN